MSTPRVRPREALGGPPWLRALYALQRARFGAVLEATRLWARAPAALFGFLHLYLATDGPAAPLAPALRSLVMVKVAQTHDCAYCVDLNAHLLSERGVPAEKLAALATYETSERFSPLERAALDYAIAMSQTRGAVDDALVARLRAHLDEPALVALTALVAMQNASARFNAALGLSPQGFCTAPADDGSPRASQRSTR